MKLKTGQSFYSYQLFLISKEYPKLKKKTEKLLHGMYLLSLIVSLTNQNSRFAPHDTMQF